MRDAGNSQREAPPESDDDLKRAVIESLDALDREGKLTVLEFSRNLENQIERRGGGLDRLLDEWLADESGYDEEAGPSSRKPWTGTAPRTAAFSLASRTVLLDAGPLGLVATPAEWTGAFRGPKLTATVPQPGRYALVRDGRTADESLSKYLQNRSFSGRIRTG